MEGWLYGLFTLLGVLVGGFFTYLGLRRQLQQQKEINEIEWKRKVRSEPLLELRNVLAIMVRKQESVIFALQGVGINDSDTMKNELNKSYEEWSTYINDYQRCLYIQYDTEIVKIVQNIMGNYHKSWLETLPNGTTSLEKFNEAMKTCDKNNDLPPLDDTSYNLIKGGINGQKGIHTGTDHQQTP